MSKLWVVAHDIHWPKTNLRALGAMLSFLKENEIEGFVFGGDQFDNECISHHTSGKGFYRPRRAFQRDERGFDEQVLGPVERAVGRNARRVYIIGNHERFEHDFVESHPELEGVIDHTVGLRLEARGWKIVPLGHAYKIGKLHVIHGEVLTGIGNQAGMYPSRKAVELYAANVLAGHTHAPQSFTRISPVEKTQKWMGWIAPILGNVNPEYLRNRPTAWANGFTVVEGRGDGNFNCYPILIHEGKFSFGGRTYGA